MRDGEGQTIRSQAAEEPKIACKTSGEGHTTRSLKAEEPNPNRHDTKGGCVQSSEEVGAWTDVEVVSAWEADDSVQVTIRPGDTVQSMPESEFRVWWHSSTI